MPAASAHKSSKPCLAASNSCAVRVEELREVAPLLAEIEGVVRTEDGYGEGDREEKREDLWLESPSLMVADR